MEAPNVMRENEKVGNTNHELRSTNYEAWVHLVTLITRQARLRFRISRNINAYITAKTPQFTKKTSGCAQDKPKPINLKFDSGNKNGV